MASWLRRQTGTGRFHVTGAPEPGLDWSELATRLEGDGRLDELSVARYLVTGGSRGIGAAIASRLTEDGYKVVTLGRTSGDVQADIGDSASVQQAFEAVRNEHGPICHGSPPLI